MRDYVRHPTDIPIQIRVAENPDNCVCPACSMTDVSQGGMACEVDREIAVGSQVDVDIVSVSPEYHGTGEVMWCRKSNRFFEIGIRFLDEQEAYKSRMVQQVCQIEHYKNMVYERDGRELDGEEAAAEWISRHAASYPV